MAEITAASVGKLREMTGAGLMDCKKALVETQGDIEVAMDYLRKKGIASAEKKASRAANEGVIAQHIQSGAKVGVLVEIGAGKAETVGKEEFKQLVRDITLQIAAGHPHAVSREQVAPEVIAKEREIAASSDRLKGKPPQAMEKILAGVLDKFFQTYCLVDQGFVKNPEQTIAQHVAEVAKKIGDEITIRRFVRFQVGEGIA